MIKNRLILIAIIIITPFLFFIRGPERYSPRSIIYAWNLGHVIYYALLPLVVVRCWNKGSIELRHQIIIAFGLAAIVGTLMESFQFMTGRLFDPYDLIRNMIGAMLALSFVLPMRTVVPNGIKIITVVLVLTQLYPIATSLIDEYQAIRDFPVLSDFETPFQTKRWHGDAGISRASDVGAPGNHALRADLSTATYSGIQLSYFQPDWQDYHSFQFQIYNPSPEPIVVTCRIHDEQHAKGPELFTDRFNKTNRLPQGWNTITIDMEEIRKAPRDRTMNLAQIRGIAIFTTHLANARTLYIDNVKLSKHPGTIRPGLIQSWTK